MIPLQRLCPVCKEPVYGQASGMVGMYHNYCYNCGWSDRIREDGLEGLTVRDDLHKWLKGVSDVVL